MQETWENVKKSLKGLMKSKLKIVILIVLIIVIVVSFLAASVYFITIDDGTYKEGDWSNTNYGASQFINNISVNSDGTFSSDMTTQELWDKMIENGCNVNQYLDKPEELLKLMRAEMVTQYPDMRGPKEIDKEIDWSKVGENELQGIVKFKRADSDQNISSMTYVDEDTFYSYIEEYNNTGSEDAKTFALTHFTLKKASTASSGNNANAIAARGGVMTDVSQAIIDATNNEPWPGEGLCQAWVYRVYKRAGLTPGSYGSAIEAARANIISTDMTAIPIGAAVYGTGSGSSGHYGHVGIYIGDGKIVDSVNSGKKIWNSFDEWLSWQVDVIDGKQGWLGWGWADGDKVRGTTQDPNLTSNNSNSNNSENKQNSQGASSTVNSVDKSKLYFIGDSWIEGLQSSRVAETSYFYGKSGKHAGSPEMAISSIPEKSDASAIVLYLGVNDPSTYNKMNSLIDELANKYKGKTIYVLKVSPVNPEKYNGSVTNEQIHNYNEKVKAHCANKENVQFLEVASCVTDSKGYLTNTSDGLHLDSYQSWYNCIISEINGNSNNDANTPKGVEVYESGDGYNKKYTSSAGITYIQYKQNEGSYAQHPFWSNTIATDGCGPTALSIIASGITNFNYTPKDIADMMTDKYGTKDVTSSERLKEIAESLGMTAEVVSNPSGETIQNNLRNGKVMLLSTSNKKYANVSHFVALLDINTNGQVYLSNPNSQKENGWQDINDVVSGSHNIVVIDAGAAGIANVTTNSTSNNSTYVAVVATWTQIDNILTTNDSQVEEYNRPEYIMTTTTVDYQAMVNPYTMPFDLLWAFLVIGEEKEFVLELADLVYNSDIQITVYDNLTVDTDVDTWRYTKRTKAKVDATVSGNYSDIVSSKAGTIHVHDPYKDEEYLTVKTVITKTNTINVVLTRANTWVQDYINEYTYAEPDTTTHRNVITRQNEEYPETPTSTFSGSDFTCKPSGENCEEIEELKALVARIVVQKNDKFGNLAGSENVTEGMVNTYVTYNSVELFEKYIKISDAITNTTKTKRYIPGVPGRNEKTDEKTAPNFVTIFNKPEYSQNRRFTDSVASWLFEIIETNDSTEDWLDLIKYLLHKATGNDYGVNKWKFDDLFTMKESSSFGQISGNTVKEQVWNYLTSAGFTDEAAAGVMGNMEAESGVDPTCIQSGGAGPAAGICQWENYNTKSGRWKEVYDLATNRGKDWTDLQCQLDFLMTELEASFKSYTGNGKYYYDNGEWCWWPTAMTSEEFMKLTNIDEATEIFMRVYERPSITHLDRRINAAKAYYNMYHGQ